MTSIENIPEEFEGIKELFKRVPEEDLPEITRIQNYPKFRITFQEQLQQRYGEALMELASLTLRIHFNDVLT